MEGGEGCVRRVVPDLQALGRLLDVEESKRVVHLVSSRQEAKDLGLIDDIAPKDGLLVRCVLWGRVSCAWVASAPS